MRVKYINIQTFFKIMSYKEKRKTLVQNLIYEGRILSELVKKSFLKTPRELFLPDHLKKYAYVDTPLGIGKGQTISVRSVSISCPAKQSQISGNTLPRVSSPFLIDCTFLQPGGAFLLSQLVCTPLQASGHPENGEGQEYCASNDTLLHSTS